MAQPIQHITRGQIDEINNKLQTLRTNVDSINGMNIDNLVNAANSLRSATVMIQTLGNTKDRIVSRMNFLNSSLTGIVNQLGQITTDDLEDKLRRLQDGFQGLNADELRSLNNDLSELTALVANIPAGEVGAPNSPAVGGYKYGLSKPKKTSRVRSKTKTIKLQSKSKSHSKKSKSKSRRRV